jgi:serine/threonine-protein kinase
VYSLGVLAYEALAGKPPFDGRSLVEIVCQHITGWAPRLSEITEAPRELCKLVHQMLDKDPSLRPGTIEVRQIARAVAKELARAELDRNDAEPRVVDSEALERGVTERMPALRRPRWTPELGAMPPGLAVPGRPRATGRSR